MIPHGDFYFIAVSAVNPGQHSRLFTKVHKCHKWVITQQSKIAMLREFKALQFLCGLSSTVTLHSESLIGLQNSLSRFCIRRKKKLFAERAKVWKTVSLLPSVHLLLPCLSCTRRRCSAAPSGKLDSSSRQRVGIGQNYLAVKSRKERTEQVRDQKNLLNNLK